MEELRDLLDQHKDDGSADDDSLTIGANATSMSPQRLERGASSSERQESHLRDGEDRGSNESGRDRPKPLLQKRNYLNTENLRVPLAFPASIHKIVEELSAINIARFPNATLDLLRTFLEKTIKAHAEVVGQEIKKSSNEQGFVYLSNCLIWLEQHFKSTGQTSFIQPVQKIRDGRYGFVGSKAHLDATNHNHQVFATPDDVRECWATIEGVMKAVLKP